MNRKASLDRFIKKIQNRIKELEGIEDGTGIPYKRYFSVKYDLSNILEYLVEIQRFIERGASFVTKEEVRVLRILGFDLSSILNNPSITTYDYYVENVEFRNYIKSDPLRALSFVLQSHGSVFAALPHEECIELYEAFKNINYEKHKLKDIEINAQLPDSFCFNLIKDFDNITDEEIKRFTNRNRPKIDALYYMFGDRIFKLLASNSETYLSAGDITYEMLNRLLSSSDYNFTKQALTNCIYSGTKLLPLWAEVTSKNPSALRYLPHIYNMFKRGFANTVWKDTDPIYTQDFKYALQILTCCKTKSISRQQLIKLKNYGALIKMYGWDYERVINTMLNSYRG